jgi:hypothetical protein
MRFHTSVSLFLLAILACGVSLPAHAADQPGRTPVLIELFTSEGCSSCPPADAQLQQLDRAQPVPGVDLIVLSEHVDYWDSQGWKDPYSSAAITERQATYVSHFALKSSYTPEMVIDGRAECVGGDPAALSQAMEKAHAGEKVAVHVSNATIDSAGIVHAHVEIEGSADAKHKGKVNVALALDHAESQVKRGENEGRKLTHVAVVLEMKPIGQFEPGKPFSQDVQIKLKPGRDPAHLRVIAFVQENGPGAVLGAAQQSIGN